MKYLVTGGAGFIGSHLADRLARAGHDVTVLDDLSTGKRSNLEAIGGPVTFVQGDIRDHGTVLQASRNVDVIFHQAAVASTPGSIEDPVRADSVNIGGTVALLTAARDNGVRKVVFASSAAVYGSNSRQPLDETTAPQPRSPYALQKLTGEHYLSLFRRLYGLAGVTLRYFNVFGPRQDATSEYGGVISIYTDRFGQGLDYTIFGDGRQTRDFIHVEDVVRANLAAAAIDFDDVPVINVASGRSCELLDIASTFRQLSGHNIEPRFAPAREGEIRHSRADNTKLRTVLGVEPSISLEAGLRRLWAARPHA